MERHRNHGERFNDQQPLNSTSRFPDDHRPNFPADHHLYHHNHHYHPHHHHNHQQFQHQPSQHQHFERFPDHQQPSGEQNDAFWSNGGNGSNSGRKRGFHHSGRGASPEHTEGSNLAKLYVATVPRTVTGETIRSLFQEHGNVVEVIQPKDKKTGERHGYCFVKYAMFEEAERAIKALHNQYTFPGELTTVKVRYADAERDRLVGLLPDKLYVGCLNKQASKREIEEIFSPFGHIQDIYIVRDEHRENRGCGFVQFSHREMAQAAITGLNGIFTMKGCDQPLIVRFANPKRPRNGEPRGNYPFNSITSGSHPQEFAMRSVPNLGDSMAGCMPPNASYPVQHILTNSQPQGVSHWANPEVAASHVTYQSYPLGQQAQSQPTSLPLQQTQTPQESSQSSHQAVSEQKQVHLIPSSSQIPGQQNSNVPKLPKLESPQTGSSQTIAATSVAPTITQSLETVAPLECDWSEHTCPDGHKYYYNCVTCESRWNKPEEFTLFEKLLQKQQKLQNLGQQLHSHSTVPSTERFSQNQEVQVLTCLMHQKLKVQQPLSTLGLDRLQIKSETSPVVDPTCV